MSRYSYPESTIIDRVTFAKTANGAVRAYIHAHADVDVATLQTITQKLQNKNWQCIPATLDGMPVLEIRGFGREEKLMSELKAHQWTQGRVQVEKDKEPSLAEKFKKRTLQASGALYVIGDVNFFKYGRKEARWEDMLAGIMYGVGTGSLLFYGRNDQSDLQVKQFSKKIAKHLMKEGMKLPEDCSLRAITKEKQEGLIYKTNDLFKHYPSEIFSLFTALAGACIAGSALRHKVLAKPAAGMAVEEIKKLRTAGWLDVGLGTMTMASMAVGGLVPEKAHDPDAPPETGVKAVLDWVQERPLTVAGAGLMVSTGLHAISSWIEARHAKRMGNVKSSQAIKNRIWFVASNLAAEFLVAVSSKGHGKGVLSDTSVDDSVIALTADLILKQPATMQDQLIDYMAKFLGRPDVLAMKDGEVRQRLQETVEAQRKNPWVQNDKPPILPPRQRITRAQSSEAISPAI